MKRPRRSRRTAMLGARGQCRAMRVRPHCCEADAAVIEEQGERRPALQHVIDRLGDIVLGDSRRLLAHPVFELGDERGDRSCRTARRSGRLPLIARSIANSSSMRRTTRGYRRLGELGQVEEVAPAMAQHAASMIGPGLRSPHRERRAGIGVGLQDARPGGEMRADARRAASASMNNAAGGPGPANGRSSRT